MTPAVVTTLQRNLARAGFDPGAIDGVYGAKTIAAQLSHLVARPLGSLGVLLAQTMLVDFRRIGVVTPLRIAHFMPQAAHETNGFRNFVELGSGDGPDADPWDDYLQRYDYRADLGNGAGGDGERYRGRGIFQLTGHANYAAMGKRIGVDLLAHPERAADPDVSVLIACLYWDDHQLNACADNDNDVAVGNGINRGNPRSSLQPIGQADRHARLLRAKSAWGLAA